MNLNRLKTIAPRQQTAVAAKTQLFKTTSSRQTYANTINLSSQMSKPENQGMYGTCVAWSSTTFIESILWKLTGEKEEFTTDEIYNLYLDTYGYNPINDEYLAITVDRRKLFYNNGDWSKIPDEIGNAGLYHWNTNCDIFSDTIMDQIYVYYWIIHYNDLEVRKNHYPDKYSRLCEKAKNYIYKNMYSLFNDDTTDGSVVNPLTIKNQLMKFGMPICAGLIGNAGGHQVVCAVAEKDKFKFNSSWDESEIYYIDIQYDLTSNNYYTNTSYSGLNLVQGIDYYRFPQNGLKINILSTNGGYVYGVEDQDRFISGIDITLEAIPENGKYFHKWIIQDSTQQSTYFSNPYTFPITSDISVRVEFTDQPNTNAKYTLNIAQPIAGNVIGADDGQMFSYGDEVVLSVQLGNHIFQSWNDGNTDNPRTLIMTENKFVYPLVNPSYDSSETVIRMFNSNTLSIAHAIAADGYEISANFGE